MILAEVFEFCLVWVTDPACHYFKGGWIDKRIHSAKTVKLELHEFQTQNSNKKSCPFVFISILNFEHISHDRFKIFSFFILTRFCLHGILEQIVGNKEKRANLKTGVTRK